MIMIVTLINWTLSFIRNYLDESKWVSRDLLWAIPMAREDGISKAVPLFKSWKYRDWLGLNSNPWLIWLFCLVLSSVAPFSSLILDLNISIGDSCGLRLSICGDPCLLSISSSPIFEAPFELKYIFDNFENPKR